MADAAIARRQVGGRPVAVPSGAAATKPKSEGLAMRISADDRERFVSAARRYDSATPSTEERFSAMKEFMPLLKETYRRLTAKVSEKDATDEDRKRHHAVGAKLSNILQELGEGVNSNRYEIRQLAFRILAENQMTSHIVTVAKTNKHEDMRQAAVEWFVNDIAKKVSSGAGNVASATKTYVIGADGETVENVVPIRNMAAAERKQLQQAISIKKDGLLDIGVDAIYSDTRQMVAEYFASAGDTSRLSRLRSETRYQDTKILIGDLLARMQRNSATTAELVEACIADYFGGDKEPAKGDDVVIPPIYSFEQRRKRQPPEDLGFAATGTDSRQMAQA